MVICRFLKLDEWVIGTYSELLVLGVCRCLAAWSSRKPALTPMGIVK